MLCDVTYGTNNELGFDYLRDNMKFHLEEMVQRGHNFAIVDEVDSILIDEARTPLIISGPIEDKSELYNTVDTVHPASSTGADLRTRREAAHRDADREGQRAYGAGAGRGRPAQGRDALRRRERDHRAPRATRALRAHKLFQRDKDYIVKDDQVIIIDEFTGRMMPGRRYSEGLHQALEAKEHVAIQPENQTLASITFQNYFRLYEKLAGMTGTAVTEAEEFMDIYRLDVIEIPTNVAGRPQGRGRRGLPDGAREIQGDHRHHRGCARPQAAGAGRHHLDREIGNPRRHAEDRTAFRTMCSMPAITSRKPRSSLRPACPAAVTIATNMAGRGTDIKLGGNAEMRIATELAELEPGPERTRREAEISAEVERNKQEVISGRRPLRHRHRAP